jgi:hypothetical protein
MIGSTPTNSKGIAMSNPALESKSFKTTPWFGANDTLRDLVAAMPIMIVANAVRDALAAKAKTVKKN